MKDDVFEKYYKTMTSILGYKETDENGNIRKCTVPLSEAKKNPERYKLFTCKLPALNNRQFAYDPELVQKHTDQLRELCKILPHRRAGLIHTIYLNDLLQTKEKPELKEVILAETFLAMAKECNLMRSVHAVSNESPNLIRRSISRKYSRTVQRKFFS